MMGKNGSVVIQAGDAGFAITVVGDCVTVKGEGFELSGNLIKYDLDKQLLICDQALLSIMENPYTLHRIGCTRVFYNVKDHTYRVEGLAYPGGVLTFPH
jgi:hypothetical protein